jgi:hypothetical protein
MADNIALDKYYGEVIHVAGKCWIFSGLDDIPPTHTSGEISAFYADCNDCLTGGTGIPFSEISGSLLGDPHFLFGGSSPETASFNVDDNISTNEVVWFTAIDADDNEIIVKYRCQEFVNVDDGYNVDRLIIEDGSLSSVYEVSTDNSDVLKNGIIWNSEDSDIILGSNVWNMKVSSATVPNCPNDFSWIPFEFGPMSGMNNLKEVGGMWWYLWKKASTLSGITLNNPSSAGLDGVSGFLNGFNGYSSRTDFEATPSSVRETFDQATMNEVSTKRNALALQTGSVDFGWDPIMDSPPSCICPPDCAFPGIVSYTLCNFTGFCDINQLHGAQQSSAVGVEPSPINSTSMDATRVKMEDFNASSDTPRPGAALVQFRDNNTFMRLARVFLTYNFGAMTNPHAKLTLRMGPIPFLPFTLDPPYSSDIYVVYFNGVVPNGPGGNEASLISSWDIVKVIPTDGLVQGVSTDFDIKLDFLTPGTSNIGLIIADDYNNDFSFMDTIPNNGQANEGIVLAEFNNIYDCG